jgi:hypothetical protein
VFDDAAVEFVKSAELLSIFSYLNTSDYHFRNELKQLQTKTNKIHGFSPQANYIVRATAACR